MAKTRIPYILILLLCGGLYFLTGQTWSAVVVMVLVLYGILAFATTYFGGRNLQPSVLAEGEIEKDRPGRAALQLANGSLFPVGRMDFGFDVANLLTKESQNLSVTTSLAPKGKRDIDFSVGDSACGVLSLQQKKARVMDPLGLFFRDVETDPASGKEALMMVRPEQVPADIPVDVLERYDMESFRFAEGKVGSDSSETVGIREYVPGDSVRAVHWKLTAKEDDLMVKEFGLPVDTKVMILSDKRRPDSVKSMDRRTEYTLSLSRMLCRRGIHHDFGWYDESLETFHLATIRSEEDIYQLQESFLSSPFTEDNVGAAERFLASEEVREYATYLYVTDKSAPEDGAMDRLKERGYVSICTPE